MLAKCLDQYLALKRSTIVLLLLILLSYLSFYTPLMPCTAEEVVLCIPLVLGFLESRYRLNYITQFRNHFYTRHCVGHFTIPFPLILLIILRSMYYYHRFIDAETQV